MIWRASISAFINKFYSGIKFYVDYQAGIPTNDGLSPQTPVDTITTAISKASAFYRVPKVIYVMQGNPTKKGDIMDEQIVLNIPWTMIDFGFTPLQLTTDGITGVTLGADYCGIINANLDGFNQATNGIGIELGGNIGNFVIASQIQNFKTNGIIMPAGYLKIIENCIFLGNKYGVRVVEAQGFCLNSVFIQNDTAVLTDGNNSAVFFTKNALQNNVIDIEDNQYYYTAIDGVGSLNKLTSASASWTPGQYTGFLLIDSAGKGYKITGNTATELNVIGVNLDGTSTDITPSDGNFWIVHAENDCFFYENYWDKLKNASPHIYGDSNEDGVLDRLIQMPAFGIGVGKSSVVDIKPLTASLILGGSFSFDFLSHISNLVNGVYKRDFLKAMVDIPDRNIRAGMLESIKRKIGNLEWVEEYSYDAAHDVIKTEIKK